MKERRRFERYCRSIPVKLKWDEFCVDGQVVDLSMTGAGCYSSKRIPLYTELNISFYPEDSFDKDEESFNCSATVVRCFRDNLDTNYKIGLFFTHLSEETLSKLMGLAYY